MNVQRSGIKSVVQLEVIELMAMKTELFSHFSGKLEPNNFKWYSHNITVKYSTCCLFYPSEQAKR